MTPREQHNAAALESLLPLLEAHVHLFGAVVSKAQWVSPPDVARPPQPPEPDCEGRCPVCADFHSRRCHLREERWAAEWARLRRRYPELAELELAVQALGAEQPQYASALYWVHVQPWDAWNPAKRGAWAEAGIAWLAEKVGGWLPVVDGPAETTRDRKAARRAWIAEMLERDCTVKHICREVGCSDRLVTEVKKALEGRP